MLRDARAMVFAYEKLENRMSRPTAIRVSQGTDAALAVAMISQSVATPALLLTILTMGRADR